MDIKTLLPSSHIVLNLEGDDRHSIWSALCQPLVKDDIVSDLETFVADLDRREQQITMQMEKVDVALPHARSNAVRRLGLTVGIADRPLRYNSDAGPGCRMFFLIAIPAYAPTAHLPVLQHLAAFAQNAASVEKTLASKTPSKAARQIIAFKA